ncbi:unnamed protein product [Nezara viridula]|uniref:Uncharacterized protein n=1 Tax=Nezara viridula TaxID=85310 RepID=A0A9P0GYK4_NEZVI|nr:unnamed protein product [Nezara viridula]
MMDHVLFTRKETKSRRRINTCLLRHSCAELRWRSRNFLQWADYGSFPQLTNRRQWRLYK